MSTSTTEDLPRRTITYQCPGCGHVETQTLAHVTEWTVSAPVQEETLVCSCDKCFSAKLDTAMPGARERMTARLEREAKAGERRAAVKARAKV